MKPTLLIDGDCVVYKFACGLQKQFDWGEGVTSQSADADAGRRFIDHYLEELSDLFDGAPIQIALSDPTSNWRIGVLDTYKANRSDFVKPIIWAELRAHMESQFNVRVRPTLEGDDVIGIMATHPSILPGDKVIVGIDKDFKTIPGRHYNPSTREHFAITEPEADWWHLYQTLVGDVVDNYKGCPYVGPVKARRYLGDPGEFSLETMWSCVEMAFESRGLTPEHALQQAQVARICRHTDYDFNRKRVIPWQPPSP